jgi:hypothetical protein
MCRRHNLICGGIMYHTGEMVSMVQIRRFEVNMKKLKKWKFETKACTLCNRVDITDDYTVLFSISNEKLYDTKFEIDIYNSLDPSEGICLFDIESVRNLKYILSKVEKEILNLGG